MARTTLHGNGSFRPIPAIGARRDNLPSRHRRGSGLTGEMLHIKIDERPVSTIPDIFATGRQGWRPISKGARFGVPHIRVSNMERPADCLSGPLFRAWPGGW
jgi:hypothetical protein